MQSDLASIPQPHIADATNYWGMREQLTLLAAIYSAQHGDGTPLRTSDSRGDSAGLQHAKAPFPFYARLQTSRVADSMAS
jgi:hypothetical protein